MPKSLRMGLVVAATAALAALAAACGSNGTSGEETDATSAAVSGKITVWDYEYHAFPNYTKAANQLDAEFEKLNPGVEVERIAQPLENYETLAQAAFAAHEGPDVMMMSSGAIGVLHFKEGLEVLNDRISPELQEQIIGWENVTPGFVAEGDHYGVPFGVSGEVLYYNKALFEKAGLPREFKPKTWDEVIKAAEKLEAAGIQPFTGGNKEGYENGFWLDWGWQSMNTPQQATELAEGEMPYTDEAVEKSFGPQFEINEAGYFPSDWFSTALFTEGVPRFGEGKGAMAFGFMNAGGDFNEFDESLGEKNVGFILPPGSEDIGVEADHVFSIPKFAKNQTAAWAFIEFLASPKSIETAVEVGKEFPSRKDVSLPKGLPVQAYELDGLIQKGNYVHNVHSMLPGPVFFGPLLNEVNQALQGRISLSSALEAMQETSEKISTE